MATNTGHAEMPSRALGSTKARVSAIGLGGWPLALKTVDEPLSIRIVRDAIHRGINFMDNCWDYNDGASEIRMGKALRDGYRSKVFLMTKIDGRSKKEAARQIEESLRRLQTDCIDLVQHHESCLRGSAPHLRRRRRPRWLIEGESGGKDPYIGFTGHKDPRIHWICSRWKPQRFKFATGRCRQRLDAHDGALKNWFARAREANNRRCSA